MYLNTKLRPQMVTCEIAEQDENEHVPCCGLGCWLLVWGILRLIVSVLWTGVIVIATVAQFLPVVAPEPSSRLIFGAVAIVAQLVEFGMIVTFITAGVKKSARLYRVYYRYCILTLIIYIVAVTLCLILDYDQGHYLGEIYLTYHINDFETPIFESDAFVFGFASFLSVCLEVLLIFLIKKMINKYSVYD